MVIIFNSFGFIDFVLAVSFLLNLDVFLSQLLLLLILYLVS